MSTPLVNKVTIVTGASRGIGQAIAELQAVNGASVVINYARNKGFAEDIVHCIQQNGGQALAVQADVSNIADLEVLFQATIDHFGHIDILVNSAGIMTTKPIEQVTEQDFDREFAINVKGIYFACQLAAKYLQAGGRIINFSTSVLGQMTPTYEKEWKMQSTNIRQIKAAIRDQAFIGSPLVWCPIGRVVAVRRRKGQLLALIRGWGRWYPVESVSIECAGRQLIS